MISKNCPVCGTPAPEGATFCDECGYDLRLLTPSEAMAHVPDQASQPASSSIICPACGHANRPQAIYCERCGAQLAADLLPAYEPPIGKSLPDQIAPDEEVSGSQNQAPTAPARLKRNPRLVIPATQVILWFPSNKTEIVLGREDAVSGVFPDISLEPLGGMEAGVSRRHAKLLERSEAWFIEDLNSVNGTFLNQQRLNPGQLYELKPGDMIHLGKLNLEFLLD